MKALVLYHYLFPDDVISSRHFSDLCHGLVDRGWEVTASCCTRSCRDPRLSFPLATDWNGVKIRRVWRPGFPQASSYGRLLNSLWMIAFWSLLALNPFLRVSQLIIGTDPVLSILVVIPWKLIRPRTKIAHWCFDLYPEAAIADRLIAEEGALSRILNWLLSAAYRRCDLVADLGPCMKTCLSKYLDKDKTATTIPVWAMVEPNAPVAVDESERQSLFSEARLALMYSGNFGKAHSYKEVLDLAEGFGSGDVKFVFSARGNRANELSQAIKAGPKNVRMAHFAALEVLEKRLAAADVHIVTLRPEWTGAVVPSKFFGAIAAGRPVLFIGSASSGIASWVRQFEIGWVLDAQCQSEASYQSEVARVVRELKELAEDRSRLQKLFCHCHSVYQANFSRKRLLDQWHRELGMLASGETLLSSLHTKPIGELGNRS